MSICRCADQCTGGQNPASSEERTTSRACSPPQPRDRHISSAIAPRASAAAPARRTRRDPARALAAPPLALAQPARARLRRRHRLRRLAGHLRLLRLPEPAPRSAPSTRARAATSTTATSRFLGHLENVRRVNVPICAVPKYVRDAFVATEDRRFYEHNGLDWRGVFRAVARNFSAGGIRQGFSTITMQVAHNSFLARPLSRPLAAPQARRAAALAAARARAHQGPDPRALPQRHLPRQRRERHRGGEPRSVRQARRPAHARRRRDARRAAQGAVRVHAAQASRRARCSGAISCSASWRDQGYITRDAGAARAQRAAAASPRTSGGRRSRAKRARSTPCARSSIR